MKLRHAVAAAALLLLPACEGDTASLPEAAAPAERVVAELPTTRPPAPPPPKPPAAPATTRPAAPKPQPVVTTARPTPRRTTAKPKPPPAPPRLAGNCHPSYPDVCIPPAPPDLDCPDVSARRFRVVGSDPHGFDGDNDGIGCEGP